MRTFDSTVHAWKQLRATRAEPPAVTLRNQPRRDTYVFALEQAEQMFRAAATVGPATQPLLVYYGLSQAGRAVAAAANNAGQSWRLVGHGISCKDLTAALGDIAVFGDNSRNGSFVRLSEILGSPLWGKDAAVRFAELWDGLPDSRDWPLVDGPQRRTPLGLALDEWDQSQTRLSASVFNIPPWVIESKTPRKDLALYMSAYPRAVGYSDASQGAGDSPDPHFAVHPDGWGETELFWPAPTSGRSVGGAELRKMFSAIATSYRGTDYLLPAIGTNAEPLHPLMSWWAVLYTLSLLARYEPAEWHKHIDVDQSPHAVAIEHLLTEAMYEVPLVIAHAIQQVSQIAV